MDFKGYDVVLGNDFLCRHAPLINEEDVANERIGQAPGASGKQPCRGYEGRGFVGPALQEGG